MDKQEEMFDAPSISIGGEEIKLAGDEFRKECISRISGMASRLKWKFISDSVSKSDKWGLVFRADFVINGEGSLLINRVICWIDKSGEYNVRAAFGQAVPPL